jgi:sialate O-acetylesterase
MTRTQFTRTPIRFVCWGLAIATAVVATSHCRGEVALPSILGDHMVLQRGVAAPIWGWANPEESVTVTIDDQEHQTKADAKGNWSVRLQPLEVGAPRAMTIQGQNNKITLRDVLVGEVWVCSGQSNMQWPVATSWNADLTIAAADHPQIRLITVETPGIQQPLEDFQGKWEVCRPETVGDFSAVGYLFGLQLHDLLEVPIGLIDNAWGGSSCEAWVQRDRLQDADLYGPLMKRWEETESDPEKSSFYAEFEAAWMKWQDEFIAAKKAGQPLPPAPRRPNNPMIQQHRPANLFMGRVEPVMPFAIRGVIWYQGESNASRAFQYRELFPLMIRNWRDAWEQGSFPFYWVQLADYRAEKPEPGDSDWAELREAQTIAVEKLPSTGQAVIIDLGEGNDIHPRNKLEVGKRLARLALAKDYGMTIVDDSPRYASMQIQDGKVELTFADVGGGLRTVDENQVRGFALAGEDRVWHWAQAKIVDTDKSRVLVWSEEVPRPLAVRYAWADNPVCNLYSAEGLPVTPFRTDDWPGVTDAAR